MITSADEYLAALFKINDVSNIPSLAKLLPSSENIYNVDLSTRTIEAPEFISVVDDHLSETIYFLVDRFYDNIDLSTTGCLIQYVNANKEGRIYLVPYYDIETYHTDNKMLIPWCIEGEATKAAGTVTFSLRFFSVDETKKYITFNFNTLPATSLVKDSLNILNMYIEVEIDAEDFTNGTTYYTKTGNNDYTKATTYDAKTTYYVLTDGYDYSASLLESIMNDISLLKRDTQAYWFNATDENKMI